MPTTLPDGLGSRHIKNIKGMSPDEAWAVSIRGDVLHTTDGGVTWHLQTLPDNALDVDFWKVSFVGARR